MAIAAINGTLTHVVALLTDRGVPLREAVGTLSGVGIALILGRVFSGWCLDRVNGVVVAIVFFLVPMAGIALLASGLRGAVPFVGAALCGIGVGAEVDLMAFFVGRYFGLRAYGRIYGVMFAAFALANGIGPSTTATVVLQLCGRPDWKLCCVVCRYCRSTLRQHDRRQDRG